MSGEYDRAVTDLLGALSGAAVDFVVIGGWALAVHGAGRATFDVDVVPDPVRSYDDLIAMKSATGRPQDEIDVTDLRRARGDLD